MLAIVVIENGQKKYIPLTADAGAGNPVGSLLHTYKKSNPSGYLYCDGSTFDQTKYPLLYAYLGSNVLPDYREVVEVGAEQNTTDTIATHDVYTEGQFKDDQLQEHKHYYADITTTNPDASGQTNALVKSASGTVQGVDSSVNPNTARVGTTTHGKQKAVFIYIKATSGLTENQQENVLNTINENLSYSTTEHKTGKKWIDGKPIYRKVVECGALPNSTSKNVATGIDFTVCNVIKIEGVAKNTSTSNTDTIPIPFSNVVAIGTTKTGDIAISTTENFSIYTISYVILEYTKTTDN